LRLQFFGEVVNFAVEVLARVRLGGFLLESHCVCVCPFVTRRPDFEPGTRPQVWGILGPSDERTRFVIKGSMCYEVFKGRVVVFYLGKDN
jgi:hypothetical protein